MPVLAEETEKEAAVKKLEEPEIAPLPEQEGWQILKAALLREVGFNTLRVVSLLAVLGGLVYLGLWSCRTVASYGPQIYEQLEKAAKMLPAGGPPKPVFLPVDKGSEKKAPPVVTSAPLKAKVAPKRHRHKSPKTVAARSRAYTNFYGVENPTGGQVNYSDGTITEYSWK